MYGQNYNRYGSPMPQRPGGVDLDELRQRRAARENRMTPMPVTDRPEPVQASAARGFSGHRPSGSFRGWLHEQCKLKRMAETGTVPRRRIRNGECRS
jgi:hypothetical protein